MKCDYCDNKNHPLFGECPVYKVLKDLKETIEDPKYKISEYPKVSLNIRTDLNCGHFYQESKMMEHPIGAVSVLIVKDGQFIMGKRKGSHGAGKWHLPGGKIDMGETWSQAAIREVFEETGLHVTDIKYHGITDDIFPSDEKQFLNVIVSCKMLDETDEPKVKELEKCEKWGWFKMHGSDQIKDLKGVIILKDMIFKGMQNMLKEVNISTIVSSRSKKDKNE